MLASGSGTNLQAIIDGLHGSAVEVACVGSNKVAARALERADSAGIATGVFRTADYPDRLERDRALAEWLRGHGVELVALAGYMELLSSEFIKAFEGRIVNVHPSLLPSFPGLDAIGQALAHGVKVTGVTVHFVDEGVDTGPIIAQRPVEVPASGDADELEAAIHAVEHELYPEAIRLVAEGRVEIDPANPRAVRVNA